jgi:urea transporter
MEEIRLLIIYTAAYILSYATGRAGLSALSSACLIGIAVFFYLREKSVTKEILNLRGLMALGLLGGEGIARLQLSNLSTEWTLSTWFSFFIFYPVFYLTSKYAEKLPDKKLSFKNASSAGPQKS